MCICVTRIFGRILKAEADKLKTVREDTLEEVQRLKIAEQELDQVRVTPAGNWSADPFVFNLSPECHRSPMSLLSRRGNQQQPCAEQ